MLPGTVDGMNHVCYFRHALALDERRVKFLPEYAYGGTSLPPTKENDNASGNVEDGLVTQDTAVDHSSKELRRTLPHTKEVWFAGTHSDM